MPSAVSLPRIAASRADRPAVLLAVVAAVIIGVVFSAHVDHYAFLGDDAFISFRYARNLVDGHGLVWNRRISTEDEFRERFGHLESCR